MPLVHVHLMQGRSEEQLVRMIRAVSDAVATSLGAPIESVRVIVSEMQPHHYGVGGKTWPEVVEERQRAAQEEAQP